MVIKLNSISIFDIKLTELQEKTLLELSKTTNFDFICKKLNLKAISLTSTIKALETKKLFSQNKLTEKGKKMVHYLNFRNETISLFLSVNNNSANASLYKLDYKAIIMLRNLLS